MDQAERAAKQIDSGRNNRWPDTVVVEHERFDQVVGVTAVVRSVNDTATARRGFDSLEVLADAFHLAKDRIQRVLSAR